MPPLHPSSAYAEHHALAEALSLLGAPSNGRPAPSLPLHWFEPVRRSRVARLRALLTTGARERSTRPVDTAPALRTQAG